MIEPRDAPMNDEPVVRLTIERMATALRQTNADLFGDTAEIYAATIIRYFRAYVAIDRAEAEKDDPDFYRKRGIPEPGSAEEGEMLAGHVVTPESGQGDERALLDGLWALMKQGYRFKGPDGLTDIPPNGIVALLRDRSENDSAS